MALKIQKNKDEIAKDFWALKTINEIAQLLEIPTSTLTYYAYRKPKEEQYKEYEIPKRNGKTRTISAPISSLKIIQRKLNAILLDNYTPRSSAFAFTHDKNAIKNAAQHKNPNIILKIDLKDFFDQIHFGRVRGIFMSHPFNFDINVASCLANICTYKAKLPQGAPTSPVISNIICWGLDKDLQKFAESFKLRYTRYADDITFSYKKNEFPTEFVTQKGEQVILSKMLEAVFEKHDLKINYDKLTIKKNTQRQLVTGVVVNQKVNVRREYIRQIRKELFIWERYGYEELEKRSYHSTNQNPQKRGTNYTWSLQGKLNYLRQVKGDQDSTYVSLQKWFGYLKIRDYFNNLKASSKYQKRGYALEDIFNTLFKMNKIDVKEAFRRNAGADQIDGAFISPLNSYFLVECKWTKNYDKINKELDAFQSKLSERSGQGTYGLFISIAGYNENAVGNLKKGKSKNIMLIDGKEIETILNNRSLNVGDLVEWKLRKLLWEAQPFSPIDDYVEEKGL